jgi:hypothetical protein
MSGANAYRFLTSWRVEGTCGEVADILGDPLRLPEWWPSVYLDVEELTPAGSSDGIGRRVRLLTKGWLPYTLRWELTVTESNYPNGFSISAAGDFDGAGIWSFTQDGAFVDVTYDWRIQAEKPLLRSLSFLLRPVFEANHRWAMVQGEESLRLELARRRTSSSDLRRMIPPPPGPTTLTGIALAGGIAAGAAGLTYLLYRVSRRSRRRRHAGVGRVS